MTRRRLFHPPAALVAGMLALTLLSACGGEASVPDAPPDDEAPAEDARTFGPGEILTPDDAGAVVRLVPGDEASLHLTPPWQDAVAEVGDQGVVELVPVEHFVDPGYAEYTLVAHGAGQTEVVVQGPEGDRLEFVAIVQD